MDELASKPFTYDVGPSDKTSSTLENWITMKKLEEKEEAFHREMDDDVWESPDELTNDDSFFSQDKEEHEVSRQDQQGSRGRGHRRKRTVLELSKASSMFFFPFVKENSLI